MGGQPPAVTRGHSLLAQGDHSTPDLDYTSSNEFFVVSTNFQTYQKSLGVPNHIGMQITAAKIRNTGEQPSLLAFIQSPSKP